MTTTAESTPSDDLLMRSLGAFEEIIDLYTHRNPVQFTLAAECSRQFTENELVDALRRLQRLHPLLTAEIHRSAALDGGPTPATFHHSDNVIPVRVIEAPSWEREAGTEQTTPISPRPGPLVEAVLVQNPIRAASTVLLTFSHQIADGKGALRAMMDLLSILDGAATTAQDIPAAQETLLARAPDTATARTFEPTADAAADAAAPAARLRPFNAATPTVETCALSVQETRALVEHARAQACTVQSALCAAAALALLETTGQSRVRINVPIDLRPVIGGDDDVAVRFTATMITLSPREANFWELTRSAAEQLRSARPFARIGASALAEAGVLTSDAAEAAMLAATAADIEITNLGTTSSPRIAEAIWGPTMTTGVEGEQILGVITHAGSLRMVHTAQPPTGRLADQMRAHLQTALRRPQRTA